MPIAERIGVIGLTGARHGKPGLAMYNASHQLQAAALPPELAG
jgi:hypothetical protein